MDTRHAAPATGADLVRRDADAKVAGRATYAYEHPVPDPVYVRPVVSTVGRGRVEGIDAADAERLAGVLTVLTCDNAPRIGTDDAELAVLQSDRVAFRGQIVAAVVAETDEIARQAADLVRVSYEVAEHDAELSADRTDLYAPDTVNPAEPTDTGTGDLDDALRRCAVRVDRTYRTAMYHNNPMEPHAAIARWHDGELSLYDSTQGVHQVRSTLAPLFGLPPERVHVSCPYVGGGFGSKGQVHAPEVLAALAAVALPGRFVKLAVTRQQMFWLVGYRTPTIQRVRLGADRAGRLSAIGIDVVEQTSRIKEFAEQTGLPARTMYAAPNRRTTHRLAALDVPVPSWMRAPGECPGMFGPEVAMDELAVAAGIDPVELRVRNEPAVDPDTGRPFSSRNLVACLREGARRFGWDDRDPAPRSRRDGGWWVGTGVAASTYPARRMSGCAARVRYDGAGHVTVSIGAADLGTGSATALAQLAADALHVPATAVRAAIGDTRLPRASVAGGSTGTATWGTTVVAACRAFRDRYGDRPPDGAEVVVDQPDDPDGDRYARHAFGAQFAEVRVHADTGEIRVPRLLGVFAVGRVVNPRLARSQLVGGMTMGLSMALHETSVLDPRFGQVVNHDLAGYHIAACADVDTIEARWVDERDEHLNPMGTKGIGEIGIVGTAAAVANAAWHASGVRVRELPITCDTLLAVTASPHRAPARV